jgi:hypothetical protein
MKGWAKVSSVAKATAPTTAATMFCGSVRVETRLICVA